MKYEGRTGKVDTSRLILKVNHAGEFGAVNIYRTQLVFCRIFMKDLVPLLEQFLEDEKRHLETFWQEIQRRNGIVCKSYWLCGLGGVGLGFVSVFLGRRGIMACTWAVESVVVGHLKEQMIYLKDTQDIEAYQAVKSIYDDEVNHMDTGFVDGGKGGIIYGAFRFAVSTFTEGVIRFGMTDVRL